MDPFDGIDPNHDSTYAMAREIARRGYALSISEVKDLTFRDSKVWIHARALKIKGKRLSLAKGRPQEATAFTAILMRKDPPVDERYQAACMLLGLAASQGVLVTNAPHSLLTFNEKLLALRNPRTSPKTLVSANGEDIAQFARKFKKVVLKPLHGFAGREVFVTDKNEPNFNVITESLTQRGGRFIEAQEYLPAIRSSGDKRVIVINGEPVGAIARIPGPRDHRGNMAAGAKAKRSVVTQTECETIASFRTFLKREGILLAGFDFIGGRVTEINITSPTGFQEIERLCNVPCSRLFVDALEEQILLHARAARS